MNKDLLDRTDHQGAKGPLFIGNKLLVYERDHHVEHLPGYLDFPGGGKESDETVFETFNRETKEEFGLTVKRENILFVKQYPSTRFPGELVYFLVAELAPEEEPKIKFGKEGVRFMLLSVNEYLKSDKAVPYLKERLEDYLAEAKRSEEA